MISGIDRITYCTDGTPDNLSKTRQFMLDWGLQLLSDAPNALRFEAQSGAEVRVLAADHADLQHLPAMEPGATLREVVWGLPDAAALAALQARIKGTPTLQAAYKDTPNGFSVCDPHGLAQLFQISSKREVAVQGVASNPYGAPRRIDTPSPIYERATPVDIGHVVLFSDCLQQAEDFYVALGFTVSDRYPGRGVFLRCSPTGGHHDVFLLQLPGKAKGLNHVAFSVRDVHEVFGGGLHMSRCGWKTQLGPGRHPISSAFFWYFDCPCGGLIEYNADEDHLTPAWQPREFAPSPTAFAEWAIDGGLDGHTRRQPNVEASGKFLTEKR